MGVYIKGMEMPGSCYYCPLADGSWGYSPPHKKRCLISGKDMPVDERYVQKNQPVCPLVPVPPHGRLIDADALADVFRGFIAMYDSCPFSQLAPTDKARRDELQTALAEVINAPTVIPAEEDE